MSVKARLIKLEPSLLKNNNVLMIAVNDDETNEQDLQRCSAKGKTQG
ncbi:MAG: hypothetical protein PHE96_03495 [Methylococcales bacterium]|nr:hypothetical protein [Methylococcales bacterium]